ncbi:hypothetical protein LEP1GSC172_2499 [Leptospira noguchii]|uniref:Uncharacterized protein n=2 Tax=Leptospira noguchii TaxID=28182 RepID=T0GZG2_9LEPT|nr:hypothetical protein LEP1GSC172_2499 [Leptospira noguchii]EQA72706.1 hypothetical protein LEP1GSC059_2410 [Leptospira noguchii serovar Panama str. CZ214]
MISFVFRKEIQTVSKTQGNFKFVFGLNTQRDIENYRLVLKEN